MTTLPIPWLLVAGALVTAPSCGPPDGSLARRQAPLPDGVAALVGTDRVDVETVARIAKARETSPGAAREDAIFDALMAAGASSYFGPALVRYAERAARARVLLESFRASAERAGPPSDGEVAEVSDSRWWELDRPPLRRTTHAVVLVEKAEQEKGARALAERLASAVASAVDASSFRSLASGVTAPGLTVKVEDLEPVAADGRAVNPAAPPPPGSEVARYSPAYAAATFDVPGLLRVSPVVRTEFGFHVILVTELVPEHRIPLEERRRSLSPEVLTRRASKQEKDVLERTRAAAHVDIERSALDLMEKVRVVQ